MGKSKNIYDYKIPKSSHQEEHYLFTKGRITLHVFILRLILPILLLSMSFFLYYIYALPEKMKRMKVLEDGSEVIYDNTFKEVFYFLEIFTFILFPLTIGIFILIQSIKRLHDVNKSGWYILLPIYGIFLLFKNGTEENNNYGIVPKSNRKVEYFDELGKLPQEQKNNHLKKIGLFVVIPFLLLAVSYGSFVYLTNLSSSSDAQVNIADFQDKTYTSSGMKWIDEQGNEYEDIIVKFTFSQVDEQENKLLMQCEAVLSILDAEPIQTKATIQLIDNTLQFEEGELAKNLNKGIIKKIDSKNITITDFNQKWTLHN